MAFPQTILPLVSEILIDGVWTEVTSDIRRDDGNGIRVSRKALSWAEQVAPTTAAHTFDNPTGTYYGRNPLSPYFGLLGRNTQIRHRLRLARALFTATVSSSWPTADTGQTWTTSGGSASDYSSSGGEGFISLGSVGVPRSTILSTLKLTNGHVFMDKVVIANGAIPAGASVTVGVMARYVDASNFLNARLVLTTSNEVLLQIRKVVGGVSTALVTSDALAGKTANGSAYSLDFALDDGLLKARVWDRADAESTATTVSAYDTSLMTAGQTGVTANLEAGNSNVLPFPFAFDGFDVSDYRFWGEIPSFTPQADQSSRDLTVPIIAAGPAQRLGAGARPLDSALTRAMAGISAGDFKPVAHWPMEDSSDATQFASAIDGQPPGLVSGVVNAATYSAAAGSLPVPILTATAGTTGEITGTFPATTLVADASGGTIWQIQFMAMIPSTINASTTMIELFMTPTGGDNVGTLKIQWDNSFKIFTLRQFDGTGVNINTGAAIDFTTSPELYDRPILFGVSVYQTAPGGLVGAQFSAFLPAAENNGLDPYVSSVSTWTAPTAPSPRGWRAVAVAASSGWSFSHLGLYTDPALFTEPNQQNNANALDGYLGELAGVRIPRLGREEGVTVELAGDAADTAACGAQLPGSLMNNFLLAADADQGILFEARDAFALRYRTRASLYNTTSMCTLAQTGTKDLSAFAMTDDDRSVRNKVTSRRTGGSFATAEITSGGTSTAEPPNGIGEIPEDLSWNLATDSQVLPFAGWRAHRMGWDEPRYTAVGVRRERSEIYGSATLDAQVLGLDIGSRYTIADPRADLPPDDISLLVQGYDETLANFEHSIIHNNQPAAVYDVFELDNATFGRLEGDHALNSSVTTSATSWSVKTLSGPVLEDADVEDGQQWMVGGELVTVTDIAGTTSPQTVTVTRNVNGIVGGKAHDADTPVVLFPAPYLAL